MKIGLVPVNVGVGSVENIVSFAKKAEEVGIESLWTFEHVIVPEDYKSKYPGTGIVNQNHIIDDFKRQRVKGLSHSLG